VKTFVYPDREQNSWAMKPDEYERFMEGVERLSRK